jgi:hypothetical protein
MSEIDAIRRPGVTFVAELPQCDGWEASPYEDAFGLAILYVSPHHSPLLLRNGRLEPFEFAHDPPP